MSDQSWKPYPGTEFGFVTDMDTGRQFITTDKGSYEMPKGDHGQIIRYRIEDDGSVTFFSADTSTHHSSNTP